MAATLIVESLDEMTTAQIKAALAALSIEGGVAHNLIMDYYMDRLGEDWEREEERYAEDGYVRFLETRGAYYAGSEEEARDKFADYYGYAAPPVV